MGNDWRLHNRGYGDYGYGDERPYHDPARCGGYGHPGYDDADIPTASGSGGNLRCSPDAAYGYGHPYPRSGSGSGGGEAYGTSWTHGAGFGSGRSHDYYAAGYGVVNGDDRCEDGHGDGGLYEHESLPDTTLYYHTFSNFNAYGGQ
jgi:hypothetical protein